MNESHHFSFRQPQNYVEFDYSEFEEYFQKELGLSFPRSELTDSQEEEKHMIQFNEDDDIVL